jgi:hypothetical protein
VENRDPKGNITKKIKLNFADVAFHCPMQNVLTEMFVAASTRHMTNVQSVVNSTYHPILSALHPTPIDLSQLWYYHFF